MSDSLNSLLKQLLNHINDFSTYTPSSEEELNCKKKIQASFHGLMNYINKLMLGYDNEEVHGLLKIMNEVASTTAWYASGVAMMDMMLETIEELCNIKYASNVQGEEIAAGFDEEVRTLLDQLDRKDQFQVISIVGTAGLGKTTLARKVYMHPLIKYKFHIRAWTCVSQEYVKRNLLLGLLKSCINILPDKIYQMSDGQLGEKLFKHLKDQKYLVVLDDIWDCKVWNDVQSYFPDDRNGSRVLFTSRDKDVSVNIGAARPAHVLCLRTADECWEIFRTTLFRTRICPHRLEIIAKEISNKCEGLPLAVVITAGLLKHKWLDNSWRQISDDLRLLMVRDPSQYIDSLTLSYNHLPPYLRPCFLFLGVFPEDYDIPVAKLIWLWVAQGFIHQSESKIFEDVAEGFLMELIQRSLLMTAKVRADGRIKACRIHDLLRDFCLRKAVEEQNSLHIYTYARAPAPVPTPESSTAITPMQLGMPTHSSLYYPFELGKVLQEGGSVFTETYKSLKILDVESVFVPKFPSDVIQLADLRYLAIRADDGSPPASISDLVNLQMLIILSRKNIIVPKTVWNLVNLRHLYIKSGESGENRIEEPYLLQMTEQDGDGNKLNSLQTLSQVCPQSCQNIFSRTPNLRKLGFCGPLMSNLGDLRFPNIVTLEHLQKLKLINTTRYPELTRLCSSDMFPEKLQRLTLSNTGMDWEQIWTLTSLTDLKVLKLGARSCIGEKWGTSNKKFDTLKILKLHDSELVQWDGQRDNFPNLQRLVVRRCLKLNNIPLEFGYIYTLEVIEVSGCSISANESAIKIQKHQESEGSCMLKVQTDQQCTA